MLEGRKYCLNDTCGILVGPTKMPDTLVHPEDDYEVSNGVGVGMQIHLRDVAIDPVVVMDRRQLKELIRYLKKAYRASRRYVKAR